MTKPLVADHRTEIRGFLQEMAVVQFTDAEIDACLNNALAILATYEPCHLTLAKTTLATDTVIDLSADCAASAVIEIIPAAGVPIIYFRVRGTSLILSSPAGATTLTIVYRDRWKHDGTNTDCYPLFLRGAVTMLAAGLCLNGRAHEVAEQAVQYPPNAQAMQLAASQLIDYAILMMQGGKIAKL
ncbi:MAG TPA: hypothetical protein VGK81_05975 [Anaerolineae bacterium]